MFFLYHNWMKGGRELYPKLLKFVYPLISPIQTPIIRILRIKFNSFGKKSNGDGVVVVVVDGVPLYQPNF